MGDKLPAPLQEEQSLADLSCEWLWDSRPGMVQYLNAKGKVEQDGSLRSDNCTGDSAFTSYEEQNMG